MNKILKIGWFLIGSFVSLIALVLTTSCSSKYTTPPAGYQQVNLVSDNGAGGERADPNLLNAWGIAIGPTGLIWISANHSGSTVVYDENGNQKLAPVNIPLGANPNAASPTGIVFNNTTDFIIPNAGPALFIFATEDGAISAWNKNTGGTAVTFSSTNAVYKGVTLANCGGSNFIYAADFHNGKIDVFDTNFHPVTNYLFKDPNIPAGYAPFNIQNIDGVLYVTYARQLAPDNNDDDSGAGRGFVDVYTPIGGLIKRFATQGTLNSPWAIVRVPSLAFSFGQEENAILIGNFGDGRINVFNSNGTYQGQLMSKGAPISIPGLWALTFDLVAPTNPNRLYFTAGPGDEDHGLFGYLEKM